MGTVNWKHQETKPEPEADGLAYADADSPTLAMLPLAKKLAEVVEGELAAIIGKSTEPDRATAVIAFTETGRILTISMPLSATSLEDLPDSGEEYDCGLTLYEEIDAEASFKGGDEGKNHLRDALMGFDKARSMSLASGWIKHQLTARKPAN